MERLLKHIYNNYSEQVNAVINQYIVDNFNFDAYYIEPETPLLVNIYMSEDEIKFDIKIVNKLIKKKKASNNIFSNIHKKCIFVNCRMKLNEKFDIFEIIRVDDEPHSNNEYGRCIQVNGNLVPKDKKYPMQEDAYRLLVGMYGRDKVDSFDAIPIRDVAKRLGLKIVEDYIITLDRSSDGLCVMLDEPITIYDVKTKEPIIKRFKAGTILIDGTLSRRINKKAVNFAIAHEIYHWLRHRYFVLLRRIVDKLDNCHIICKPNGGSADFKSDDKRIEIQADKFAGSILLCHNDLKLSLDSELVKHNYYTSTNKKEIVEKVLNKLSNLYQVNKMPLVIRYNAEHITYVGFEKYIYDFNNKFDHFEIYPNEFFDCYSNNSIFKNLIDSKRFVYINNHVVIYDEKYIHNNKLTSFARANLKACCINFSYKFKSIYVLAPYGLGLSKEKKEVLIDNTKNKLVFDNSIRVINEAEDIRNLITNDFKESLKNLRIYRKMTQSDLAEAIKISNRNYQNYEEADTKPKKERLLALINALHLPPDYGVKFYKLVLPINKGDTIYVEIMNSLYMESLDVWNMVLKEKGYPQIVFSRNE